MNKVIGMVKPETTVTRQEMYTNESLHWRSEHTFLRKREL